MSAAEGPSRSRALRLAAAASDSRVSRDILGSTIDRIVSWIGILAAVVLVALGGLMLWASVFVNGQVHDQLAAQKIFFPPQGSTAIQGPQFAAVRPFAGQQLVNGRQAEVYADHFIAVHLQEIGGGKTYAQLSAEALAQPKNTALQDQVQTLFRGTTLRSMLLNAYAFGTVAQIAGIAAIVSWVGAAALAVLAALGFVHARSVDRREERERTGARREAPEDIRQAA